jgi:hypothetical protein
MERRHHIERRDDVEASLAGSTVPDVGDIEVEADYLGPARPRIPRELADAYE